MNNKTFLAIVLTSLFWVVVWFLCTPSADKEQEYNSDLAEKIVGVWEPLDKTNILLEFTQYGTLRLGDGNGLFSSMLKFNYKLNGHKVNVEGYGLLSSDFRVEVSSDEQGDYLEIYDIAELAGKYRRQLSAKKDAIPKRSATSAKSRQQAKMQRNTTPKATKQSVDQTVTERPAAQTPINYSVKSNVPPKQSATSANSQQQAETQKTTTPKTEEQSVDQVVTDKPATQTSINYAEAIVGKWHPVEGAKNPIEITKYGTIIQWHYGTVDIRRDYTISGNKMKIKYYGTARVEVIKEDNNTYLEIYDVTEYSGKYRKVK